MTREGNANTARGAGEFVTQVINNARAAGATGEITMRFDSGFFSRAVRDAASAGDVRICITTRMSKRLKGIISDIQEDAWTSIPYWLEGGADVAEVKYRAFARDRQDVRLIVRRVKPTPGSQLALFRDYDYHAFITDRQGETLFLEADHRVHAQIELVIKDLKGGSRWNHVPSRYMNANAVWLALVWLALVWLAIGAIEHNLARCNCTTRHGATAQPDTVQLHNPTRCNCTQPGTVQLHTTWHGASAHNLARCNCTQPGTVQLHTTWHE